ncbi:MAG TPA: hypothetical protein VF750_06465 [Sphingomicrobium sp.]
MIRLLNWQGIVGLGVSLGFAILLVIQHLETSHWKEKSASFEQLYRDEQAALAVTVANARAAVEQARAADKANTARVAAQQHIINERTANDFEARLAAARARADQLLLTARAAADSGARGSPPVPGLSAAPGSPAQAAGEGRLPAADALTATEQAIQLDELINWVKAQARVEPSGTSN